MPREIKFRVWDTSLNKFIGPEFIGLSWDGYLTDVYDSGRDVEDGTENKQAIITQWTGLKDRNGVEIYEGDVLSDVISRGKKVLMNVIVYEKGAFRHKFLDENTRHLRGREIEPMFDNTSLIFEVAGNIYEHPHLLPKEEQA